MTSGVLASLTIGPFVGEMSHRRRSSSLARSCACPMTSCTDTVGQRERRSVSARPTASRGGWFSMSRPKSSCEYGAYAQGDTRTFDAETRRLLPREPLHVDDPPQHEDREQQRDRQLRDQGPCGRAYAEIAESEFAFTPTG